MKLARRPARETPEPIIALIDVVFFLLVFFLLVGRMDATAPFEVTPATAESGSEMPGGGATIAISASGALALDGAETDRSALLDALDLRLASAPETLVRINAHRDAELRNVLPLAAEIEALGARDVVLVVTPSVP
jgi:biopolymer transport protein ExbD